ncbi:hypothetical protein PV04_04236 [Phialophora macrospora]|uniref:Uncharacterized protein n=1 Tax=Phialophora macrospora TaxID=1851006 RepID=A0A0D2G8N2_9EURO|nr:hypothetical protein PV04_04236 [Phialophora macrospora]
MKPKSSQSRVQESYSHQGSFENVWSAVSSHHQARDEKPRQRRTRDSHATCICPIDAGGDMMAVSDKNSHHRVVDGLILVLETLSYDFRLRYYPPTYTASEKAMVPFWQALSYRETSTGSLRIRMGNSGTSSYCTLL